MNVFLRIHDLMRVLKLFYQKYASKTTTRGFWTLLYELLGRGQTRWEGGGVDHILNNGKLRAQNWQSNCAYINRIKKLWNSKH